MEFMTNMLSGGMTLITAGLLSISIGMGHVPDPDPEQLNCLAYNIYHEARSEVVEGQLAVAHVTLNRVESDYWPDTICKVVYQPKQFSWTFTIKNQTPREKKAWAQAKIIARDVMVGNTLDPTNGATFYHANYVNPEWVKYMDMSKVVGLHLFYTWDGDWNANN